MVLAAPARSSGAPAAGRAAQFVSSPKFPRSFGRKADRILRPDPCMPTCRICTYVDLFMYHTV